MRVKINGKSEETTTSTVLELLQSKDIEPQMVSVELNSEIVDREAYGRTAIKEDDAIEFLFFMGGGSARPARVVPGPERLQSAWKGIIRDVLS